MAGTYAAKTDVPVAKSRIEIEQTLARYGATGFGYMTQGQASMVAFEMRERRVLLRVTVPAPDSREVTHGASGQRLPAAQVKNRYEQIQRQRWRALLLLIKAKLEAVESGIETFEEAFLAHLVIPSTGQTYGDMAIPQITQVYQSHALPPMVPSSGTVIALGEVSSR